MTDPTYLNDFSNLLTATEDEDAMEDEEHDGALCAAAILAMAEVGRQVQIENHPQT